MQLLELLGRALPPEPWQEGDNIPWHEPGFSARMLREHGSGVRDWSTQLWALLVFRLWYRAFAP